MRFSPILTAAHLQDWLPDRWMSSVHTQTPAETMKKSGIQYGRSGSIWEETNVIGVTPPIYNDTVSVSKTSKIMDDAFKTAIQNAFINIGKTEDGKKVIAILQPYGI